jgi:hypothetical protein
VFVDVCVLEPVSVSVPDIVPEVVDVPVTVLDTVASAECVLDGVLEGVAVSVVVEVWDQAVPVIVCVAVTDAVFERLPVLEAVFVIVLELVCDAVDVELVVTVPVRLAVRVPDAVTVGVPVLASEFVAEPEGVPERLCDLVPVFDTLFVCVAVRVTVEDWVVLRVAVPDGFTVFVGLTLVVAALEPEELAVGDLLAVEVRVVERVPDLLGVILGVAIEEPDTVPD